MLGSRPIPFLKKLLKEHGDVVRFDVGPQPTVLIGNFDILRDLFKREVSSSKTEKDTVIFSNPLVLPVFQQPASQPGLGRRPQLRPRGSRLRHRVLRGGRQRGDEAILSAVHEQAGHDKGAILH